MYYKKNNYLDRKEKRSQMTMPLIQSKRSQGLVMLQPGKRL
jgi:hypothetical protein